MMESRSLIKEIPSGKFHSAVMTSFSINLYYWEIQLLRALSAKGINYVSAIVDSECLSEQLFKYCKSFSDRKPLDFSLHGYKMKGAFHPKIQFYAGKSDVLVLVGSGNLTITGHGRNLEIWSPVMVDSVDSPAYPFVRNVWDYLKGLYHEIGPEAENIIYSIESNCELLANDYKASATDITMGKSVFRFFTNQDSSIYSQWQEWIGADKIKAITIMAPFYDSKASLIKAFHEQYHPEKIRIIVESGFGAPPVSKNIPDYVEIYSWENVAKESAFKIQELFHSKCFFFEGEKFNYALCGSANASVAAFGLPGVPPTNQEASVGYKSETIDYLQQTGFVLNNPINKGDIPQNEPSDSSNEQTPVLVCIKESSYYYQDFSLRVECEEVIEGAQISFYSGYRKKLYSLKKNLKEGVYDVEGKFPAPIYPLYVEITDKEGNLISNRQFVIPTESMDANNPSPEPTYYRDRYHEIESGKFVNGEVLRFIESILGGTEKKLVAKGVAEAAGGKVIDDKDGHVFDSLDDYLKDDGTGITGTTRNAKRETSAAQSTMLFDSIISYIAKSSKEKEEEDIDNEETEDVKRSEGREEKEKKQDKKSSNTAENTKRRIITMFDKYMKQLETIALSERKSKKEVGLKETLERFMTAIYFLYRTLSYRFTLKDGSTKEYSLIEIKRLSELRVTATEFFYRIASLFALYLMKANALPDKNSIIQKKIESHKQYAFELCLAVMSVCDWLNNGNTDYILWSKTYKAPLLLNLKKALAPTIDLNTPNNIFKRLDRSIQEMYGFDKSAMQQYIRKNVALVVNEDIFYPEGSIFWTDQFGYVDLYPITPKMALLCTTCYGYNKERDEYCPNYLFLYESQKVYQIKPKG